MLCIAAQTASARPPPALPPAPRCGPRRACAARCACCGGGAGRGTAVAAGSESARGGEEGSAASRERRRDMAGRGTEGWSLETEVVDAFRECGPSKSVGAGRLALDLS